MHIIIHVGPILVGFVLGYFLATPAIIVVTVIAGIMAVAMRPRPEQELDGLVGAIALYVLGLGALVMWVTHFYVAGIDFGLPDISSYIFRQ